MLPRQAIYRLLLRQGLINFAQVGTAVPYLPSTFRNLTVKRIASITTFKAFLDKRTNKFALCIHLGVQFYLGEMLSPKTVFILKVSTIRLNKPNDIANAINKLGSRKGM